MKILQNAQNGLDGEARNYLAYIIFGFSILAISMLAAYVIYKQPADAKDIFNIVLPVFASWVGTILAFYFGRDSFESASKQVRDMAQKLSPEERSNTQVSSIMRLFSEMILFEIPSGHNENSVKLAQLNAILVNDASRLAIVDSRSVAKYMIHDSSIDKYLASGGKLDDSLQQFIDTQEKAGLAYSLDKGFIIVSESTTLAHAKIKMEGCKSCQDIFVTKTGKPNEPLEGWVSNIRLAKYLQA